MRITFPKLIATGGYTGYSPIIPGTVGTAVAVVLYLGLHYLSWWQYAITVLGIIAIAIWSSDITEVQFNQKDSSKIVVDEIVGYLVTMFLIPFSIKYIVLGFILFRILDVIKPYPAYSLQKLPGGFGIVADDFVAGIYTNLLMQIGIRFKLI